METQTIRKKEENCPKCGNHCPRETLRCKRGKKYFKSKESGWTDEVEGEGEEDRRGRRKHKHDHEDKRKHKHDHEDKKKHKHNHEDESKHKHDNEHICKHEHKYESEGKCRHADEYEHEHKHGHKHRHKGGHHHMQDDGSITYMLHRFGHMLHHGGDELTEEKLTAALSPEEKKELRALLEKMEAGLK